MGATLRVRQRGEFFPVISEGSISNRENVCHLCMLIGRVGSSIAFQSRFFRRGDRFYPFRELLDICKQVYYVYERGIKPLGGLSLVLSSAWRLVKWLPVLGNVGFLSGNRERGKPLVEPRIVASLWCFSPRGVGGWVGRLAPRFSPGGRRWLAAVGISSCWRR